MGLGKWAMIITGCLVAVLSLIGPTGGMASDAGFFWTPDGHPLPIRSPDIPPSFFPDDDPRFGWARIPGSERTISEIETETETEADSSEAPWLPYPLPNSGEGAEIRFFSTYIIHHWCLLLEKGWVDYLIQAIDFLRIFYEKENLYHDVEAIDTMKHIVYDRSGMADPIVWGDFYELRGDFYRGLVPARHMFPPYIRDKNREYMRHYYILAMGQYALIADVVVKTHNLYRINGKLADFKEYRPIAPKEPAPVLQLSSLYHPHRHHEVQRLPSPPQKTWTVHITEWPPGPRPFAVEGAGEPMAGKAFQRRGRRNTRRIPVKDLVIQ